MPDASWALAYPDRERRDTRTREELVSRVHREFDGLAGLTLTLPQAMRLFNLDESRCARLLNELVRSGELAQAGDGVFKRPG